MGDPGACICRFGVLQFMNYLCGLESDDSFISNKTKRRAQVPTGANPSVSALSVVHRPLSLHITP